MRDPGPTSRNPRHQAPSVRTSHNRFSPSLSALMLKAPSRDVSHCLWFADYGGDGLVMGHVPRSRQGVHTPKHP